MQININNGIAEVTYKEGRRVFTKNVDFDTLIDSMSLKTGIATPILPLGTKIYSKSNGRHKLFIEMVPTRRHITFLDRDKRVSFDGTIPFPFGVFIFDLKEADRRYSIENITLFALEKTITSVEDVLYNWPTPNVFDGGGICWGSGSNYRTYLTIDQIYQAGRIIDFFFSSNFNMDSTPKMNGFSTYKDLTTHLKDKNVFSTNILVPTDRRIKNYL